MESKEMLNALTVLRSKLDNNGILMTTNMTGRGYRPGKHWYTFNTEFPENAPTRSVEGRAKLKFIEDQKVKVQEFTDHKRKESFIFHDRFHSGKAYKSAFDAAGLKLLETHKPLGKEEDMKAWESEKETPPYKMHVLRNRK
jgi:hypothetical protein